MKMAIAFMITFMLSQALWYLLISFWVWSFTWPLVFAAGATAEGRFWASIIWILLTLATSVLPASIVSDEFADE